HEKTVVIRHIRQQRALESVHDECFGYVERAVDALIYLRRGSGKIQVDPILVQSEVAMNDYFLAQHIRASFILRFTGRKLFQSLAQGRLSPLADLLGNALEIFFLELLQTANHLAPGYLISRDLRHEVADDLVRRAHVDIQKIDQLLIQLAL